MDTVDPQHLQRLINEYLAEALKEDEGQRVAAGVRDREDAEDDLESLDYLLGEYKDSLRDHDYKCVHGHVEEFLERTKLAMPKDSPARRELAREMLKAQIKLLDIIRRRESGDYDYERKALGAFSASPSSAQGSELLSQVIEAHLAEKEHAQPKSIADMRHTFRLLIQIVGDRPFSSIRFEDMRHFGDVVRKLPANMNKSPRYRGKTPDEILAMRDIAPAAPKTIKKHFVWVKGLWAWAVPKGYTDKNYAEGLNAPRATGNTTRNPFAREDLEKLLFSPEYLQRTFSRPYQYWLPLLALFHGGRLSEYCQLYVSDVQKVDGVDVLNINEDTEDTSKHVKTEAAKRLVPLHPLLVKKGFLDYVEALRKSGQTRVFPEIKPFKGSYGHYPSRWFSTYLKKTGVYVRQKKVFHSFRNTVIDHLANKHYEPSKIRALVGHEDGSVMFQHYAKYRPAALFEMVTNIDYGLDFSRVPKFKL